MCRAVTASRRSAKESASSSTTVVVSNNLFPRIVGHRNGEVELEWPVLAKGW